MIGVKSPKDFVPTGNALIQYVCVLSIADSVDTIFTLRCRTERCSKAKLRINIFCNYLQRLSSMSLRMSINPVT